MDRRTLFNEHVSREMLRVGDTVFVGARGKNGVLRELQQNGGCVLDFFDAEGDILESQSYTSAFGSMKGSARLRKGLPREGDTVFVGACGAEGKVSKVLEGGGLEVEFHSDSVCKKVTYSSAYGREAGSARVQSTTVSLAPSKKKGGANKLAEETSKLIVAHYVAKCPESPHVRDTVRRRVGPHLYEERQAIIKAESYDELFAEFDNKYPNLIKRSRFMDEAPWYLKDAYRETCLCASCEGAELYMEGLKVVGQALKPIIIAMEMEAEAEEEFDAEEREREHDARAVLAMVAGLTSKEMGEEAAVEQEMLSATPKRPHEASVGVFAMAEAIGAEESLLSEHERCEEEHEAEGTQSTSATLPFV